ncbi:hypothetical protein VTL71DRAFT_2694 [Oculimacula yallundae]|uniref:YjgF-like protein n=1 Tax=Oculimacula yallundae TaxID=86028 RepID=A0ABR4CBW0_9HELO
MARRHISSASAFEEEIGYSRAVVTGSWICVSGTTGHEIATNLTLKLRYDYATGQLSPSIITQTEQTLTNIETALKEAGASFKDVIKVTYILPDKKEFPLIWPVLKRVFGDTGIKPAATMMQAELMRDEMRIEIEVMARIGNGEGEA